MNRVMKDGLDVVIIGAGPAGLTAGYLLSKNSSYSIHILEANKDYVGGISRTETYRDFYFDVGGHRFFSKSSEVEALWREILPHDFIERPRSSRIFYQNKLFNYPLKAFEVVSNLGCFESFRCIISYLKARVRPYQQPKSFHEWVANQFGERLYQIFFKTYTEKVWGMSCDDISADWAAQRIKGLNFFKTMIAALRASLKLPNHKQGQIKTLIEKFSYPRRGPGMMWETAAKKIIENGGALSMDMCAVDYVWHSDKNQWQVIAKDCRGETHNFFAKHVISSAPLRTVISAINPQPLCYTAAQKLKYRDFITVAIMLKSPPNFSDNWIYIHDDHVKVGRIQNFASWSPDMVPQAGLGCLGLEYFCFEGNGLWELSDADLIQLAIDELVKLKLAQSSQVLDGKVIRQPKAYPVYDNHYKSITETIAKEFRERYQQFHFVGRNGLHKYNNQDHAMMTAILTVENILSGELRFDIWGVNEDAEYHEQGKVERMLALKSLRSVPWVKT